MNDSYKRDITLNEKDSLIDMLNFEKQLVKVYSTAISEGVSKGFRNLIKENWDETANDQLDVFLTLTDNGYLKVQSAEKEDLNSEKQKYKDFVKTLN